MIALALCVLAFVAVYWAARRDLVSGLIALLVVGYLYGIVRANLLQTLSHFTFDAGTVGLLLAMWRHRGDAESRRRTAALRGWMLLLIGWPIVLLLTPVQDPMVQLVGFRGNVFFLPFLLLGAQLSKEDLGRLAIWVAVLNLAAFGFALAEFFMGIEPFFPISPVTEIMYRSQDVAGNTAHRIPATFTSAHAYGGTMVMTMPLLLGAWTERARAGRGRKALLLAALLASVVGVLMSAARSHAIVLFVLIAAATLTSRMPIGTRSAWVLLVIAVGFVAASSERLQRFTTLENQEYVTQRVSTSVNATFFSRMREYPLGNGLGGGGTSLPYFLADRLRDPVMIENEYGRIMLEQGIPGLLVWVSFLGWLILRGYRRRRDEWPVFRSLAWIVTSIYVVMGGIGLGMLTSIPQSPLMLMWLGLLAARAPVAAESRAGPERTAWGPGAPPFDLAPIPGPRALP